MKLLGSGKVKDIYELDGDTLLFRFSDRVSAYDVKFGGGIPGKGRILCRFAEFWFDRLSVPSHFVRRESENGMVVRRMEMLPIECVVRGYLYGSLADRLGRGKIALPAEADTRLAARLAEPLFDPTTKAEHDVPVTREGAIGTGLVTAAEYDWLEAESIRVYTQMTEIAGRAGFILADLKLEFGRLDGRIVLGDSIGPDECRLWLAQDYMVGTVQEAYDKQILRDWLSAAGYREEFEAAREAGREPVPPDIPQEIVRKMAARYAEAYERIAGVSLSRGQSNPIIPSQ